MSPPAHLSGLPAVSDDDRQPPTEERSSRRKRLTGSNSHWFDAETWLEESGAIKGLTETQFKVWFALHRVRKVVGSRLYATLAHSRICECTGLSPSGAKKGVRGLKEKGIIRVVKPGQKDRSCATYLLATKNGSQ